MCVNQLLAENAELKLNIQLNFAIKFRAKNCVLAQNLNNQCHEKNANKFQIKNKLLFIVNCGRRKKTESYIINNMSAAAALFNVIQKCLCKFCNRN